MADPHGVKLFDKIIDTLWDNHKDRLQKECINLEFPEYLDLPQVISRKLNSDSVNQLQWALGFGPFANKKIFKDTMREQMFPLSS